MKRWFVLLFFFSRLNGSSQNLVPNGDFEQFTTCPTNLSQFSAAASWFNPTLASPDYFNVCATNINCDVPNNFIGYQVPHSGFGYGGIYTWYGIIGYQNYREYMEIELTQELTENTCYHLEFYMSLANYVQYTTDDIGAFFSPVSVTDFSTENVLSLTPQVSNAAGNYPDSLNWTLVSGDFTATGGERFLMIGNFKDSANTSTILVNGSVLNNASYFYIDDVCVTTCIEPSCSITTGIKEFQKNTFSIHPNPAFSNSEITLSYPSGTGQREIIINDVNGREVIRYSLSQWSSTQTIKLPQMVSGVYVARLISNFQFPISNVKFVVE
jgi:hypothetical protein